MACSEKGVYAYIKHFVANDQEINRCTAQQIYLTEQTLREIYMKPFEICVKNYDYDTFSAIAGKISRHNFFLPFSVQSPGPSRARRLSNREMV